MAGTLQIKHGAKMRVAYDAPVGQEPKFNMVCTFNKAIDESAFLVSVPMVGGKALIPEDTQKMLFHDLIFEDLLCHRHSAPEARVGVVLRVPQRVEAADRVSQGVLLAGVVV